MRLDEIQWYHGARRPKKQMQLGTGGEDVYGKGIYLTNDPKRAQTYFSKGAGSKEGYLHSISLNTNNPFNFYDPITQEDLQKLADLNSETFKLNSDILTIGNDSVQVGQQKAHLHSVLRKNFRRGVLTDVVKAIGFDSLELPGTAVVFDPNNTQVTNIEHIK